MAAVVTVVRSKQHPVNQRASSLKLSLLPLCRATGLSEQEFSALHNGCKRGDMVGVVGHPGKSKKGELSVFPVTFVVLAPCLHMLPRQPPKRRDEQGREFQPVGMNQVRVAADRLRLGGAVSCSGSVPGRKKSRASISASGREQGMV